MFRPAKLWGRREIVKSSVLAGIFCIECGQTTAAAEFRPEDYGAKGGGSNDTAAFAALSIAVNLAGGGTIVLRDTTYVVGGQTRMCDSTDFLWKPSPILLFENCSRDIIVEGNGAKLILAPGLRYGVFDPVSGQAADHPLPYYALEHRATPAVAMMLATGCHGAVIVRDVVMDGNIDRLVIGGRWGDKGWQIGCSGIVFKNNASAERIERVICRNFPLDGVILDGPREATSRERRLIDVVMDRNGRQGCSLVGGHGVAFERCRFTRTGRGPLSSAPGAGVDIEPESGKIMSNLRFVDCTFSDNAGPGMLAATPDSSDVTFSGCTFNGTTNWSAWPAAPGYVFDRCRFVGAVTNCYGDRNEAKATQFKDCIFRDTPPAGNDKRAFVGTGATGPIVDVSSSANVRFIRCHFQLTRAGLLPWSTQAIYDSCTMSQTSPHISYPRGRWLGRSMIKGRADLSSSKFIGNLVVNGQTL